MFVEAGSSVEWGPGNIDIDPLFIDPDGPDDDPDIFEDNNYRLSADSPCIDAGDNTAVPDDVTTDLNGNPRFVDDPATPDSGNPDGINPIVDIGAHEFNCVDDDGDGKVTICHNGHTISVSVNAVPAHLAHGDSCGPCEQDDGLLLMAGESEVCSADVNGDGVVNAADLALLLGTWGQNPGHPSDIDGDGVVGPLDLADVLGNWGPCP